MPDAPPTESAVLDARRRAAAPRLDRRGRLACLAVALGCLGVLLVAARLEPSAAGLGTHQRLGLPPCGWIVTMDVPCPTCGMTTAFAHAADGRIDRALAAQPAGGMLALLAAMTMLVAAHGAATGSRLSAYLLDRLNARVGWIAGGVLLAAWAYKILLHKGLLG